MKKLYLIAILITTILVFSITATAGMLISVADKAKEKSKAPEKSPVITETEAGEWELERIDFIHYAKPETVCGNGVCEKGENARKCPADCTGGEEPDIKCYKLLGVKWKNLPVGYVINPANSSLTEGFVTSAISTSAETWDAATASELFNGYIVDYAAQYGVQNFVNAVAFGNYPDVNVIAVTSIWFTRRGRQIVEFDILFDTDFAWGDALINPAVMDLQNIATHELGHGAGLDDIYSDACSEVTMYGYSTEGETKKRTLELSDITGIQKMYG